MILKTTDEILNNPWGEISKDQTYPDRTPLKFFPNKDLNFCDVCEWEEILYIKGIIGIYAAWDPYEEFYILVHNLHLSSKFIEVYNGNHGVDKLIDRCRDLGIEPPAVSLFKL